MARDSRQPYLSEPGAAGQLNGFSRAVFVAVLGGALVWVWWRQRVFNLWRQPQHAPLSAHWLNAMRFG